MTDKDKLDDIKKLLKKYRKDIDRAVRNDHEVTLAGNGINCCEADSTFSALEEDILEIINK